MSQKLRSAQRTLRRSPSVVIWHHPLIGIAGGWTLEAMAATTTDAPLSDEDLAARAARREAGGRVPRAAEDASELLNGRHARPLIAFLAARAHRGERDDLH